MKTVLDYAAGALVVAGLIGGSLFLLGTGESVATSLAGSGDIDQPRELAQVPTATPAISPAPGVPANVPAASSDAQSASVATESVAQELADKAPESTVVSGHLVNADGSSAAGGVVYFVFQNRLNEVAHADPLVQIKSMAESAVAVDEEGSFTLKMQPGNFAMIYDPNEIDAPAGPGPNSMAVTRKLTREQVQTRIAAIKENAMQGLPIINGKIGEAFVVENRYVRPPVSNFGDVQLQDKAVVTVRAVDDAGELINFPATLRLRGKNGDIMEPHTPSVSKRATYEFYDLMPQSYQVFALGTLPRPGGGDELTTPTLTNDQFVFAGEALSQDVVVEQPKTE